MSFPNYPEKQQYETILTAEDIVAYRKRLGRMPNFGTLKGVLFCLDRDLPQRMRWRIPVRKAGGMNADVQVTKRTRNPVAILTNFGGGAPIMVELAEELAVMGAKKMILMTKILLFITVLAILYVLSDQFNDKNLGGTI